MKRKSYASVAVALVTSGLAANAAHGGLYSTPVKNGDFEYDIVNNPGVGGFTGLNYGYDTEISYWYRVSGNEAWFSQAKQPVANDSASSTAYASLQGAVNTGTHVATNGEIFQSIGTYNPNSAITVNFLEGVASGAGGNSITVSLFSGGKPSVTSTVNAYGNNYGANFDTLALNNATLLSSQTFSDGGVASFNAESAVLNTGAAGAAGSTLWLAFSINSSDPSAGSIALDDVSVSASAVTNTQLKWSGSVSSAWDASTTNFLNSSSTPTAFSNGADVLFDDTAGAGHGVVNLTADVSPSDITFNNSSLNYTLQGAHAITGGTTLTKMGTGTLTIANANSFTGPVAVNAGILNLQNSAALGTSRDVTIASGATLQLQGGITIPTIPFSLSGTGAAGQPGVLVNVSGNNTIGGPVSLDADSTISVPSGNLSFSSDLNGQGALTVTGAGTLTFNWFTHYAGGTTVNAGNLVLANGSYSGAIVGALTINSGGTVTTTAADALGYGTGGTVTTATINAGGVLNNATDSNEGFITNFVLAGGAMSSTGGGSYNFDVGNGYGISTLASSTTSVISAPIIIRTDNGNNPLIITVASGTTPNKVDLLISGAITGTSGSLDKEGPGVLLLTASSSFGGSTTINGGTLQLGDGTVGHDGSLNASGGGINNNAALVYDIVGNQSYSGSINGNGTLTKAGPGTLTLSSYEQYSGLTTVSAGKLYVSQTMASSNIAVAGGATLGGTGNVYTSVAVASGGIIEAGQNGTGQLSIGGPVTFAGAGVILFGTLTNYTGSTGVSFSNAVTADGGNNSISLSVGSLAGATVGSTYDLVSYSGSDPFNDFKAALPSRAVGTLVDNTSQNQIDLTLVSVGTPITYTGAGGSVWDTTTQSWEIGASPTTYFDSPPDSVIFDDTAPSSATTVSISAGTVHPNSVTFNNSSNNYTITGPYGIAGSTGITLNGSGTVTLKTTNSFTGPVVINSGTLQLGDGASGHDGTITSASSVTNNGALNFDYFSNQTYAGPISGTGNIIKNGPGNLTLTAGQDPTTGANGDSDSGTLTVNGGTLTLAPIDPTTPAYSTQDFSSITVNAGATLDVASVHVFGYGGPPRPALIINGGTVTNSLGMDNYLGDITMTGGTVNGTGEFRLQDNGAATVTTNSAATTATFSVTSLALVSNVTFTTAVGTGAGPDLLISSNVRGTGTSLTKAGPGVMTLSGSSSYTGGTFVTAGTLNFSGPNSFPAATTLNISSGALAVAVNHGTGAIHVLQTSGLSFAGGTDSWGGTLDLNNNDLVIQGGSLSDTTNQVKYGYNKGNWNGPGGIISTAAASDSTHLTTLGVIVNDNGSGTPIYGSGGLAATFDGTTVADGDILVKYTYYGDANLDGAVDGSDYTLIDAGFNSNGALTGWQNGDFNYDGVIDGSDYTLIDNAFNTQGASLGTNPAALIAASTAQIAGGSAAVPEPATLGLLTMGAIGLIGKRRRRH